MKLVEITDKNTWEAYIASQPWPQFTQSWIWGEFRVDLGFKIKRFALVDDETGEWLLAGMMEYRPKSLFGGYWFFPRGPVISAKLDADRKREVFHLYIQELLNIRLSRALFWRFEPPVELANPEGLLPMRFRRNDPQNPMSTILLDLAPSQEELLATMHQKTRYNIKVAAKHGVTTRLATHPDDLKRFLDLIEETARRDGFVTFGSGYLEKTFRFLERAGMARLRLAEREGKILAANLEVTYGKTVTYLYGASTSEARNMMAPYALHWDAITQAKRDGCALYDFWGANPLSKACFAYKDSWEGITRFKRGWGGRQVDLYGTWDLPFLMPLYRLIFIRHLPRG